MTAHLEYHRDGSIHAKGQIYDGVPDGYWEWFRPDGTKKRTGHFTRGRQTGEWITYDQQGKPFKTTNFDKKNTKI